ncbi:UDP-N-acetylglucosamine 1-carboxyvinyltransferase [Paenibacillus mendelii]|uniref:UDP-N-acetylglucosamine 1-carboxyvinyltransferase n=1 Tax=Paenibacillus mendelii TaxID=206163 RepID=A0ABV6JJ76_9BACL|nr:UDP-N-acetylglucosamine 1-carboxyvinyltransferase [Paenibacillus mendelii]MCQ6558894.1 UDP-N-acetylglucosamine 1-carboxyvinyltransferase [Paenibacillus mendelii]
MMVTTLTQSKTFVVKGGNTLSGTVRLSGAKNAALPMIAAACLGEEPTVLDNVPVNLRDVKILIQILSEAGAYIQVDGNTVSCARGSFPNTAVNPIASEIRYSLLLLGLASAFGSELLLPMPGGCKIGDRKYDLHLMGLSKLGSTVEETEEGILVTSKGNVGAQIEFYLPTTSGTENIMIAAAIAEGETTILNANTRPEIMEMAKLMNLMGANVECSNRVVTIKGANKIKGGVRYSVMPGWDEAVTYIIASAMTGGEVCIPDFSLDFIKEDVRHLREIGVEVFEWGGAVYASGKKTKKSFDLFTAPYPGINSDMQPIFAALAFVVDGKSTITDLRFTERFKYVDELKKFGGNIYSFGNTAIVEGGIPLLGTDVNATDLRGGAACVLAGLVAQGTTVVGNVSQIERGYENIIEKLQQLGADIESHHS